MRGFELYTEWLKGVMDSTTFYVQKDLNFSTPLEAVNEVISDLDDLAFVDTLLAKSSSSLSFFKDKSYLTSSLGDMSIDGMLKSLDIPDHLLPSLMESFGALLEDDYVFPAGAISGVVGVSDATSLDDIIPGSSEVFYGDDDSIGDLPEEPDEYVPDWQKKIDGDESTYIIEEDDDSLFDEEDELEEEDNESEYDVDEEDYSEEDTEEESSDEEYVVDEDDFEGEEIEEEDEDEENEDEYSFDEEEFEEEEESPIVVLTPNGIVEYPSSEYAIEEEDFIEEDDELEEEEEGFGDEDYLFEEEVYDEEEDDVDSFEEVDDENDEYEIDDEDDFLERDEDVPNSDVYDADDDESMYDVDEFSFEEEEDGFGGATEKPSPNAVLGGSDSSLNSPFKSDMTFASPFESSFGDSDKLNNDAGVGYGIKRTDPPVKSSNDILADTLLNASASILSAPSKLAELAKSLTNNRDKKGGKM